jgi:hypothetical protein
MYTKLNTLANFLGARAYQRHNTHKNLYTNAKDQLSSHNVRKENAYSLCPYVHGWEGLRSMPRDWLRYRKGLK